MAPFKPTLIRASAGTGKTYALSSRYIRLLVAGERVDKILATTFTRKAAAEIEERIFQRLAAAALDADKARELGTSVDAPGFTSQDAARILSTLVKEQHRIRVNTLDSFFFSIAEGFSLDLGLMLGWRIADPESEQEVLRDALRALCEHEKLEKIAGMLQQVHGGDAKRSVHQRLEAQLQELFAAYRTSGPRAWHRLWVRKGLDAGEMKEALEKLRHLEVPKTADKKPVKLWLKCVEKDLQLIEASDWKTFIKGGIAEKVLTKAGEFSRKPISDEVRDLYEQFLTHARAFLLGRLREQTEATCELMASFEQEYEAQRLLRQTLSFDDVKKRLLDASVTGRLDELYYRLDSKISHLLLDEFQDTSGEEWRVIRPVVDEILSKAGGEYSFFCVGDVKQAIYGWRGGVADVFDTLERDWPQLKPDAQNTSRRCARPVLRLLNMVFGSLESNTALLEQSEAARAWARRYETHESTREEGAGFVRCSFLSGSGDEENAPLIEEVVKTVQEVRALSPEIGIGILVRRNQDVSEILYELGKAGIAASEEGGVPLTDSPAVCAVLSLLRLADHPGDRIARFHVANCPLGSVVGLTDYSDEEAVKALTARLREQLLTEGYGRTLKALGDAAKDKMSARDIRRFEQLLALAFSFERKKSVRTRDFIRKVEVTRVQDPSGEKVRVMTIHQAKGLEFDAVILPFLDGAMMKGGPRATLCEYEDRTQPPVRVVRGVPKEIALIDDKLHAMWARDVAERFCEALCVLYVALTRPRDALFVIADHGDVPRKLNYTSMLYHALEPSLEKRENVSVFETGLLQTLAKGTVRTSTARAGQGKRKTSAFPVLPGKRSKGLIPVSPSKIPVKDLAQLTIKLQLRAKGDALRGTLLHRCFETVEWLQGASQTGEELRSRLRVMSSDERQVADAISAWRAAMKDPGMTEVFDQAAMLAQVGDAWKGASIRLFREHRFAVRDGEHLVTGTFDRVVILEKGGPKKGIVYDFKTGGGEASAEQLRSIYRSQMLMYRRAASLLFSVPEKDVEVKMVCVKEPSGVTVVGVE